MKRWRLLEKKRKQAVIKERKEQDEYKRLVLHNMGLFKAILLD